MKWLEIIELRSVHQSKQELDIYLKRLCHELKEDANHPKFRIYENRDVDSDLSIHIFHSSKMPDSNHSPLSYHVASNLRSFGLVRHTIWTERNPNKDTISQENE